MQSHARNVRASTPHEFAVAASREQALTEAARAILKAAASDDTVLTQNIAQWQQHAMANAHNIQTVGDYGATVEASHNEAITQVSAQSHRQLEIHFLPAQTLPSRLGRLTGLQKLSLHVTSCTELPESLADLRNLREVCLSHNRLLMHLPERLGDLQGLQVLDVTDSPLQSLPPSIERLHELHTLRLSGGSYETLPPRVDRLVNLKRLELSHSRATPHGPGLRKLPGGNWLLGLQYLILHDNNNLSELPATLSGCVTLRKLQLANCPKLERLPPLDRLLNLKNLLLRKSGLRELPDVTALIQLEVLDLAHCKALTELPPHWGHLQKLRTLDLTGCNSLTRLPASLSELPMACTITVPPHLQPQLDAINAHRRDRPPVTPMRRAAAAAIPIAPAPQNAWQTQLAPFASEPDAIRFSQWLNITLPALTSAQDRQKMEEIVQAVVSSPPARTKLFAFAKENVFVERDLNSGMTQLAVPPRTYASVMDVHRVLLEHQIINSEAGKALDILQKATAALTGQPSSAGFRQWVGSPPMRDGHYLPGTGPSPLLMAYVHTHDPQAVALTQRGIEQMENLEAAANRDELPLGQWMQDCVALRIDQAKLMHERYGAVARLLLRSP